MVWTRKRYKRRFQRRGLARRYGRRSGTYSGRTTRSSGLSMRSRLLGRRRYQRLLWNSTTALTHYRSTEADGYTFATHVSSDIMNSYMEPALKASFWTQTGGLVPIDTSGDYPSFHGDITIRGGILGLSLLNTDDTPTLCNIYMIRSSKDFSSYTNPTAVHWGHDPTIVADFRQLYGRVIYSTKKTLLPGEQYNIERRIPVTKIDKVVHNTDFTWQWFIIVGNMSGVAGSIEGNTWHNLSFSADVLDPGA